MSAQESPAFLVNELKKTIDAHEGKTWNRDSHLQAVEQCRQLLSSLQTPADLCFELNKSPSILMCNKLAVDLDIYNVLSSADRPMKVAELATVTKAEPLFLQRILRQLAGIAVIKEVGRDEYQATQTTKVFGQPPMQATTNHFWDEALPTYVRAPDYFRRNGYKSPETAMTTVFNDVAGTDQTWFDWRLAQPGGLSVLNICMSGTRASRPRWTAWFPVRERLLNGATDDDEVLLVDQGGGIGYDLQAFVERFPEVNPKRLVLQDISEVIDATTELDSRIVRMTHDFFTEQPIKNARAYFMARILHDWGDAICVRILVQLAAAMGPRSRLLINEILLPDTGVSLMQSGLDMCMMTLHGGMERTRSQWAALLDAAGLRVVEFHMPPGDGEGVIEAMLKGG